MEYSEVKNQIKEKLAAPLEFADTQNLLELGLNSLQIMRLVNQWRKQGFRVSFGELMEHPTFDYWWKRLKEGEEKKRENVLIEVMDNKVGKIKEELPEKRIAKVNTPFPLTDVQYAYWIGREEGQVLGGVGCHAYLEFDGEDVDARQLKNAWNILQYHHPMLRARFLEDGRQVIMDKPWEESIETYDLRGEGDVEKRLLKIREKLSHRKLRAEEGQVAGIALSLLPDKKTRIHFDLDLLIADVQSLQILLRDLAAAYEGKGLPEESRDWSFSSYLELEQKEEQEHREKAKEYWRKRLITLPEGIEIPLAKRPEEIVQTSFTRRIIQIEKKDWDKLQKKAAENQTTPAILLLTAYALVLERFSSSKHFMINIPLFNRKTELKGLEDAVADFTTLLLLEVDCRKPLTFAELLHTIQKQVHQDMKYSVYSGVQIQRDLAQLRGSKRTVAPVVFACNLGTPLITETFREKLGDFSYMISQTPQVWLDFQTYEEEKGLMLTWDTVDELFPAGILPDMLDSFEKLLHSLKEESWEQAFDLLPDYQKNFVKKECDIKVPVKPACIHTAFLEYAGKNPSKTALTDTGSKIDMTYGELADKALAAAASIIRKGILKKPIAVTLPRGYEQIIAVLGILISGNCYVPVSVDQPFERRKLIHEKTEIHYVITDGKTHSKLSWPEDSAVWELDELLKEVKSEVYPKVSPEDSAYIIMTSGTTGMPKGVEIAHFSAWNTISHINELYQINERDAVLCVSAMDFDLSVYDVFGILGQGGKLVLIPDEEKRNSEYWFQQIIKNEVTVWNSVPVLLDMLLISAEAKEIKLPLRIAMLSGDWINMDLPERLTKVTGGCRFIAMGGATEASIWSNYFEVKLPLPAEWKSIPYGRPLPNQVFRVVDDNGRDCPFWVEGELWIGGCGLAKGYLGDKELTKTKFIDDKLGRWYRTGDKGRFFADGNMEFLGRKDDQVKIRGHRIELGEIEQALRQYPGIKNAVAEPVGEERGEKHLVAFLETEQDAPSVYEKITAEEGSWERKWELISDTFTKAVIEADIEEEYLDFLAYGNYSSLQFMIKMLQGAGAFIKPEATYNNKEIMSLGKISPEYSKLVDRWLEVLEKEGYLIREKSGYRLTDMRSEVSSFDIRDSGKLEDYFSTLKTQAAALLRGEVNAIEVFYKDDQRLSPNVLLQKLPGHKENLEIFLSYLKRIAEVSAESGPVKIMEVGTRDIHTTMEILNSLEGYPVDYTYTDTSVYFIDIAKQQASAYPFVEFSLLDIEEDPVVQGYPLHTYDCVIAVNSLHRVKNMKDSMKQLSRLLKPAGIIIMTELSSPTYLQDISAGFLESGFTKIEDERKENGTALLGQEGWERVLRDNGFEPVLVFPGLKREAYGRGILIGMNKKEAWTFTEKHIQEYMEQKLPEYMVPKKYYLLDCIPVTANGKVDRKKLRTRHFLAPLRKEEATAKTKTEERILNIWQALFQTDKLGVTDNYFELGGDSLVATRLIVLIQKEFSIKLSIGTIFEKPTVRDLAAAVDLASLKNQPASKELKLPLLTTDPEKENEPFPLTDVQYAYWIGRSGLYQLGSVSTHCYFELDTDKLELERLESAWNKLIKRHGVMRMVILPDARQKILKEVPEYKIAVHNLEALPAEEELSTLMEQREYMSHQVLETGTWPLFDVQASLLKGGKGRLHISFDNLIFDGWSMFHILSEWAKLYHDDAAELTPLDLSFRDYVLAIEKVKDSENYQQDKEYWMERIGRLSPAPELPLAKKENELINQRFCRRSSKLSSKEWQNLKREGKKRKLTPSVLLITAYAEVLRMWSKTLDFTINLTQFDRKPMHPQVEELVGDFTTLTLLEVKSEESSNFEQRANKIQNQLLKDLEHSFYSAVEVERELKRQTGNLQGAIMPIVFTSGLGVDQWNEGKWVGNLVYNISQTPQVWLDHQVVEKDGELCLFWDSVDELFYPGMLDEMFKAYVELLRNLSEDEKLFEEMIPSLVHAVISPERQEANETQHEYEYETLDSMFLKAAAAYPEKEAVVAADCRMTYKELKERAFYIAEKLQELKVEKEELVAVLMDKGWEQMVSVYGILFTGAAYLPLDAGNPKERLISILKDSNTRIVLVQEQILLKNQWLREWQCVVVDRSESSKRDFGERLDVRHNADSLAYVIYTSGTTGQPKGVMIDHKGAVNTILDIKYRYGVNSKDKLLALSNLNFDLSVYDIFGILGAGGTLVIPDNNRMKDPGHWIELMNQERITVWNSVPAFMQMLMEYGQSQELLSGSELHLILLSGDWIPVGLPDKIRSCFEKVQIIALGGATEASIWSNAYKVPEIIPEEWISIPYGKPLANQKYYILNPMLMDCPDFVPGILYIAGKGVAKGYFNDSEKTEEKFITHPVTSEKLYCTGDLGRYHKDGNIEFLGRSDNQFKRNGYRVELGEIEGSIKQLPQIKDAAVVLKKEQQNIIKIISFICTEPGAKFCKTINCDKNKMEELRSNIQAYEKQLNPLEDKSDNKTAETFYKYMDNISVSMILKTLYRMGLKKVGSPFHLHMLIEKLEIEPKFEKLIWNWLRVLREEDILEKNGDLYVVREGFREFLTADIEIQSGNFPDSLKEKLKILKETMEENITTTIKILRGEDNILNIIFKNEFLLTPKIAEEYNLTRIFMKEQFIRVFERILEKLDKDPLILELGNRMSGQTEEFLRILAGKGRFIYADESTRYMESYKEKYGEKYNLNTLLYDFKERYLYQGMLKHSVDVIIADNTLHRTYDIKRTLRNLKRMLCPGGILLIREFTNNSRLLLNTVALLEEGFHNLEDDRKTAGLPLIKAEQWVDLLKQQGFEWIRIIKGEKEEVKGAGECIITAQLSHALTEFEEDRFYRLLRAKLPEYMLPDQIYDVEELPLSANGKVDRKILESYFRNETEKEMVSAYEQLTELEQKVAQVWGEILEHKVPSKFDNFFKNGGDSLKAIRFVNGLKEKHGIDVKLSWLFETPDLTSLSTMIQEAAFTNETCDEGEI